MTPGMVINVNTVPDGQQNGGNDGGGGFIGGLGG